VAIVAVAAAAVTHLGVPLYFPQGWTDYVYLIIADAVALAAGGIIVAWFLKAPTAPAVVGEAPAAEEV
jgi:general stress protein CsbA